MQLTKQQKEILTAFKEQAVFKILMDIHDDMMRKQVVAMQSLDLDKDEDRKQAKNWQIYAKARLDFFSNTISHINS